MRHAVKVCWTTSPGRWLAGLLAWAMLGGTSVAAAPEDVHFTHAERLLQAPVPGFSPPPITIDSDAVPGSWQEVQLPFAIPQNFGRPAPVPTSDVHKAETVVSWFRIRLSDADRPAQPHFLYVPSWKSDGQIAVYADGRLVYQSHANLRWNGSSRPLWLTLDAAEGGRPLQEIVVRVQHLPGIGGALSTLWVGDGSTTYWRFLVREWLQVDFPFQSSAAFLALGFFSLVVWFKRRHEPLYLLFFAASVAGYMRTIFYYVGLNRLPMPDPWFSWMTVNSMYWLTIAVHLSLICLHRRRAPWITRVLTSIAVALGLATLPLNPWFVEATVVAPFAAMLLLVLGNVTFFTHLRNARRAHEGSALLLAGWGCYCMQLGAYDWLLHNNLVSIEGIYLSSYLNVGVFYILTFILYRRYVGAIGQIEQVNSNLTQHLRQREAELVESHRRLRDVEQQELLRLERRRMMQDMHDGLGSSLVSALRVVERGGISDNEVAQVLKSCIDDLKLTIDSLEPVDADLLLLLATLRFRLGPRLESSGITLHWNIKDVPAIDWLTPRNCLHILRILQEAFTNIIKHTSATEIRVSTATEQEGVVVCVADDGIGFDVDAALAGRGMGLSNQQRRAESIGATVRWKSGSDGTRFLLWLPLSMATGASVASDLNRMAASGS